jgi:hypothetical protein
VNVFGDSKGLVKVLGLAVRLRVESQRVDPLPSAYRLLVLETFIFSNIYITIHIVFFLTVYLRVLTVGDGVNRVGVHQQHNQRIRCYPGGGRKPPWTREERGY